MVNRCWRWIAGAFCTIPCALAQTTVLYQTQFEPPEFDPNRDLADQHGWVLAGGNAGNGLLKDRFSGMGYQAYLGFLVPTTNASSSSVYRPVPTNSPLVRFNVTFQIVPTTKGTQDDFRWSVYNQSGERLFSLDFESSTGAATY